MSRLGDAVRLGVRALAMGVGALALAWGVALPTSLAAAGLGAALGVVAGERLARSRLRLAMAMAALLGGFALTRLVAALLVSSEGLATALGPSAALASAAALRFGGAALAGAAALRTLAARRPALSAIELGALGASLAAVFAAHRDGIIARPLWLSDAAWQRGVDPSTIFLGLGVFAAVVLAALLLVEARSGRGFSSLLVFAALALLAAVGLPLLGVAQPAPPSLGLTSDGDAGADASLDAGDASDAGDAGEGGPQRPRDPGDAGDPRDAAPSSPDGGASIDGGTPQPVASASPSDGGTPQPVASASPADGGDPAPVASAEPDDGGVPQAPSEHLDEDRGGGSSGESPMAVVVLDDDYSPPSGGYYFRQEAWSQWNGARLVHALRDEIDRDVEDVFPTGDVVVPEAPPESGRALVHGKVALLVEHSHPFALEAPIRLQPAPNPSPARFVRAYRFTSLAQSAGYRELFGLRAGNPAWSEATRAVYLEAPQDPRYAALARSIVAKVPEARRGDPFAAALTVKLYLDDQFTYSMQHKHAGAVDPTADFLFGDRIGYCVHFAHAAVLLWRSLGIPARVGAGYRSEEDDRHGSSTILIRATDAHAWPELYLEGLGWVVLDVAVKKTLDPAHPKVDPDLQRMLGEMARAMPKDVSSTALEDEGEGREQLRRAGFLALLLAALSLLVLYGAKLWRRASPWVRRSELLPLLGYRATLDMLADVGFSRELGETREAFARRVSALSPSFAEVTAMHLAATLGARGDEREGRAMAAPPPSRAQWRARVGAVAGEIGATATLWRRALGAVNPVSFLRSR